MCVPFFKITCFRNYNNLQKSKKRDLVIFYSMQISIMSGLIENSWIFISASAFYLLEFVVLVKIYKGKPVLHRYVIGQGKIILVMPFHKIRSVLLWYYPNSTSGHFSKGWVTCGIWNHSNELFPLCTLISCKLRRNSPTSSVRTTSRHIYALFSSIVVFQA